METESNAVRIKELVGRLSAHQEALRLGNTQFAARYRKWLRSETTWARLKQDKWQEILNEGRILASLKDLAERLDGSKSFDEESFLPSLPFVRAMNRNYERLMGAPRDRRCLIALAPEGVGKSWWATSKTQDAESGNCFYVRLIHTCRDKTFHIARALSLKLGVTEAKSPAAQVDGLIGFLRSFGEATIIIDEGHNGGVALFKLLKDLIDETPVRFVYLAFPTEYDAVRSKDGGAMAEARQLLRRCIRPVFDDYRDGIGQEDIVAFLVGNGLAKTREMQEVAMQLAPVLARNQNLSTLADALDEAKSEAEGIGQPLTLGLINKAVGSLCSTAPQRRAGLLKLKEAA